MNIPTSAPQQAATPTIAPDPTDDAELAAMRTTLTWAQSNTSDAPIVRHAIQALASFDVLAECIREEDSDIESLLSAARADLLEAYALHRYGRLQTAFILLRGMYEGVLTSLLYRRQTISLALWARGKAFHLCHQLFEDKHEFYKYYTCLFEDDRFKNDYPEVNPKHILKEGNDIYADLSNAVHKKRSQSATPASAFTDMVERVFRITYQFAEREIDLPEVTFPSPVTYAACLKRKPRK